MKLFGEWDTDYVELTYKYRFPDNFVYSLNLFQTFSFYTFNKNTEFLSIAINERKVQYGTMHFTDRPSFKEL